LKEKIAKVRAQMKVLDAIGEQLSASADQQISLTDPDARSMATSGRGTGVVGYNMQVAVDAKNHLILAHEVTNVGHDRTQLASMAEQTREALGDRDLTVLADRGYYKGTELLKCEDAGIKAVLPKPLTSNSKAEVGSTSATSSTTRSETSTSARRVSVRSGASARLRTA
jgi:hypothetical protein